NPIDNDYASIATVLSYIDNGKVPQTALNDLVGALRNARLPAAAPFLSLLQAITGGRLDVSAADVSRLVDAAIENPNVADPMRAQIFDNYGNYQLLVRRDSQAAVSLTLAAAAQDPGNPLFQISLAKLALTLHRPDKVQESVAAAQR